MRKNKFEVKKRYFLNWTEGKLLKGKYLCYYSDNRIAKLMAYQFPRKTFEVKQDEMKLAKKIQGFFGAKYWYKWTPEYFESSISFDYLAKRQNLDV